MSLTFYERDRPLRAWCPDDEIFTLSRELILDRVYERGGVRLAEGMGTVVDAGAHVGIFSLQASRWAERVVALEASRVNYDTLVLNVDRNHARNVDARHCALWPTSTSALSFRPTGHSGGGEVLAGGPPGQAAGSGGGTAGGSADDGLRGGAGAGDELRGGSGDGDGLRGVSLDELVDELGAIDLLKLDVEGAEYEVLSRCRQLRRIGAIAGEMHVRDPGERRRLEVLVATLGAAGFEVTVVPEADLYAPASLARLRSHAGALVGHGLVKAIAAAYYLAPVAKPLRARGASYELPILAARRAR